VNHAVNRIAVEGVSDRQSFSDGLLKVDWCNVIVIVICSTAVTAESVELANQEGVFSSIVEGIEDWYAIDRDGDGSP